MFLSFSKFFCGNNIVLVRKTNVGHSKTLKSQEKLTLVMCKLVFYIMVKLE